MGIYDLDYMDNLWSIINFNYKRQNSKDREGKHCKGGKRLYEL